MVDTKLTDKVDKKVDKAVVGSSLTRSEEEILHLVSDEFLTVKQICLRRKCSRQAVHKILKKLKQKGAYKSNYEKVDKSNPLVNQNSKVRLHAQEFNIKILFQDENYLNKLDKTNLLFIDGNTIRLYNKSIEIYSGQSFYGDSEQIAERKSLDYWRKFFARLECELKVIIVKPRSSNIRIVNQHYARTESEICENAIEKRDRVRVYAEEDGKLAFITDDSFGFKEDECLHPKTAKPDRAAIDRQVNDWRMHPEVPTQSELAKDIGSLTANQQKFEESMIYLDRNLNTHFSVLDKIGSAVEDLTKAVKDLKNGKKE